VDKKLQQGGEIEDGEGVGVKDEWPKKRSCAAGAVMEGDSVKRGA
jgi:hypothetical protein